MEHTAHVWMNFPNNSPYGNTRHGFLVWIVDFWLGWRIIRETAIVAAVQRSARYAIPWFRFDARCLLLKGKRMVDWANGQMLNH